MRPIVVMSALVSAAAICQSAGALTVMSTFETGLDGWTSANNGATAPEWVAPV
jgi:hypothetical protein